MALRAQWSSLKNQWDSMGDHRSSVEISGAKWG